MDINDHEREEDYPFTTTRIHQICRSLVPICIPIRYSTLHLDDWREIPRHFAPLILDSFTSHIFRPNLQAVSRLSLRVSLDDTKFHFATLASALLHFTNLSDLAIALEDVTDTLPITFTNALAYHRKLKSLRLELDQDSRVDTLICSDRDFSLYKQLPHLEALELACPLANCFLDSRDGPPKLRRITIRSPGQLELGTVPWTTAEELRLDLNGYTGIDLVEDMRAALSAFRQNEKFAHPEIPRLSTLPLRRLTIGFPSLSPRGVTLAPPLSPPKSKPKILRDAVLRRRNGGALDARKPSYRFLRYSSQTRRCSTR
ncbi:hypothetical protein JCM3765_007589 [Sporobolomyces pararoseus]